MNKISATIVGLGLITLLSGCGYDTGIEDSDPSGVTKTLVTMIDECEYWRIDDQIHYSYAIICPKTGSVPGNTSYILSRPKQSPEVIQSNGVQK